MLIAVALAQPEIGMGGLFCLVIFSDRLDKHALKIVSNQLIFKCLEVHTKALFQKHKKPNIENQAVVKINPPK